MSGIDPTLISLQTRKDSYDVYIGRDINTGPLSHDITTSLSPGSSAAKTAAIANVYNKFIDFQRLNNEISTYINNNSQNIGTILSDIGTKQERVNNLKSEIKQKKSDLEVADQRDTQIKLSPPQISNYQGLSTFFGITRPLKFISVPILFGVSVFLLIVSILLIKENFLLGTGYSFGAPSVSTDVSILKDPRIWGTLFGASLIIILFMSLKIAGKLPVLPS